MCYLKLRVSMDECSVGYHESMKYKESSQWPYCFESNKTTRRLKLSVATTGYLHKPMILTETIKKEQDQAHYCPDR
jgi:hypothetical protein